MKKNYISNAETSVRMFNNNLLERVSKVHFSVPLFIYVPVVLYLLYQSFFQHSSIEAITLFVTYFLPGIIVWTITEYILHRFVFHFEPSFTWGKRVHFIFHGVHYDYPKDAKRLVMPPSVSLPLAAGFYFLFSLIFVNKSHLQAFFAGFLVGYLMYDMMHYAMHHYNFKSSVMKKIKQHHMLHHYNSAHKIIQTYSQRSNQSNFHF